MCILVSKARNIAPISWFRVSLLLGMARRTYANPMRRIADSAVDMTQHSTCVVRSRLSRYCLGVVAAVSLAISPVVAPAQVSQAISAGWVYIQPHGTSGPLTLTELGGQPVNQPQAGTGVELRPANTLLLSYEYYWSVHVSTQLALGAPPTHQLQGTGTLASYGVLGEGQQLSPALILKWHFLEAQATVRPYVGLGVNYTWYRRERVTNEDFASTFFGPNAQTRVSASPSWNVVYSAGFDYLIDADWSLGVSFACAPLRTRITVQASDTQYGVPMTVTTDLRTRVCAAGASFGYRF